MAREEIEGNVSPVIFFLNKTKGGGLYYKETRRHDIWARPCLWAKHVCPPKATQFTCFIVCFFLLEFFN